MPLNSSVTDCLVPERHIVMIVEDSLESMKLLSGILSDQGFEVRQARNGRVALAAMAHKLPDLILLDIRMPGMDGFEVCRRLKHDPDTREIPIIFISALDGPDQKTLAFETGAVDYITKPFQALEVIARVKLHLTLHRMKQELEEMVHSRTVKLEESSTALKFLLDHRRDEQSRFEENVISQINSLVIPYLERLKDTGLDRRQKTLAEVIESSLNEITSQFSGRLYAKAAGVTPREMEVAALIKMGKTNVEISETLNVSEHAVSFHRQNLRKKLGLLGRKVNLAAFLNEMGLK